MTEPTSRHLLKRFSVRSDVRWALAGGAVTAVVVIGISTVLGATSSFEAARLLDTVTPTARFAASAYIAGGAAILALMLTLLSFSISHDMQYRPEHYRRIRDVARLTTFVLVMSVAFLILLVFPISEDDVDRVYHLWAYYGVVFGSAVTGGVFVATVLMLYRTVRAVILVGVQGTESPLVMTPDAEDTEHDGDRMDADGAGYSETGAAEPRSD
ncbi:MAG: hypothetical protein R3290_07355 [Acidimicrobiia bacterium]|nr:hypothetical protein [Acidimicrobiia bacterium]